MVFALLVALYLIVGGFLARFGTADDPDPDIATVVLFWLFWPYFIVMAAWRMGNSDGT